MKTENAIRDAIGVLADQANILETEGAGESMACQNCWATIGFLYWVLEDGHTAVSINMQLEAWRKRQASRIQNSDLQ